MKTRPGWAFRLPLPPFALAMLGVLITLAHAPGQAQTITLLHNFTGASDGAHLFSGLTMDRGGNFYGTAWDDGMRGGGVVFHLSRVGSGWVLMPLYSFSGADGTFPYGGVILGPDGSLYGTTYQGGQYGYGTVYRLRPSPTACASVICPWEETVLYSFTGGADGKEPVGGNLVFDQAGNLYGTTEFGGAYESGVVFVLAPSGGGWTESVIHSFSSLCDDGCFPYSGLMFDSAGNLYGTTSQGGAEDAGVVYELLRSGSDWTAQTLASINFPGARTCGGVVMDGQGNLFGTSGCFAGGGGVFELVLSNGSWTFNALHLFSGEAGPYDTPTLDAAGNVYGTSGWTGLYYDGEVFKLTRSNGGWTYSSVSFDGSNGDLLVGGVVLDTAGNIYGTADLGGSGQCLEGCGTVWEITP